MEGTAAPGKPYPLHPPGLAGQGERRRPPQASSLFGPSRLLARLAAWISQPSPGLSGKPEPSPARPRVRLRRPPANKAGRASLAQPGPSSSLSRFPAPVLRPGLSEEDRGGRFLPAVLPPASLMAPGSIASHRRQQQPIRAQRNRLAELQRSRRGSRADGKRKPTHRKWRGNGVFLPRTEGPGDRQGAWAALL